MTIALDSVELEVTLIHGRFSKLKIDFLIFEEVVGFDAVDTHVVLDSFVLIFGLLFVIVPFIDGHAGLRGHLEFDLFGSACLGDFH